MTEERKKLREVKRGRDRGREGKNESGKGELNPLGNRNLKDDASIGFIRASRTASLSRFGSVFSHTPEIANLDKEKGAMKHPTKWNLANLNIFVSSPVVPELTMQQLQCKQKFQGYISLDKVT